MSPEEKKENPALTDGAAEKTDNKDAKNGDKSVTDDKSTVKDESKTVESEKKPAKSDSADAGSDKKSAAARMREREAEAEAIEAAAEAAAKEAGEDVDPGDLILEEERVSIPLTQENSRFFRSQGNLISLELIGEDGKREMFERVIILRAFPITNPDEFLSVREPNSRQMGRGKEIGMIRRMSDFDEETCRLFLEELDRRYFSPQLTKIHSIKDKFGYLYWEAETTAGHATFIMRNPFSNIRVLEDDRIIIQDMDGNIFEIPDPNKLDSASYKKIEIYL